MAQRESQLAAPRDDAAPRIIRLHDCDPLPPGAQFCQIVGSKLERTGRWPRRVYLVLVEQVSSPPREAG